MSSLDSIDEGSFDTLILTNIHKDKEPILDLREMVFIDPYGMVGILEIGRFLKSRGKQGILHLPVSEDVLKYLDRMDFFKYVADYFTLKPSSPLLTDRYLRSRSSDVLLEIMKIEDADDVHAIVGKVVDRAQTILATHLNYDNSTIDGFVVALSEVCQNILEHSENTGFVGIQKYFFGKRLNKNVVKISVMDIGIGFKESLKAKFSDRYGTKWTDMDALKKALLHGATRHDDIGRGHGLAAVKRFVEKWDGKITIRSGTARIAIIPSWDKYGRQKQANSVRVDSDLPFFPGAQIGMILPAV